MGAGGCAWVGTGCVGAAAALAGAGAAGARAGGAAGARLIVLGTDWRSGITHKLFGDAGCPPEPPEIVNGYYNVSGEDTCWRTPSEGSVTRYYCLEGFELRGPRELVCRNGSWVVPSPLLTSLGPQQVPPAGRPFKNIICEINGQAKVGWNTLLTAITTTLPAMMCLYLTSSST